MKQSWFGMAAVILTACAISVFSARKIEAQYASPVKVSNTAASPALGSLIDDHGRIPYWSQVETASVSGSACDGNRACSFTFGPVPAGHRLVIEHVSGNLAFSGSVSELFVRLANPNAISLPNYYSIFDAPTTTGNFDVPVLAYVDATQVVEVDIIAVGGGTISGGRRIILTGYLLDCGAAPCAPIAH